MTMQICIFSWLDHVRSLLAKPRSSAGGEDCCSRVLALGSWSVCVVSTAQPAASERSCVGCQIWQWACPALPALSEQSSKHRRGKVSPCLWADAGRRMEEEENCRDLLVHSWLLLKLRIYLSESKSQCWDVSQCSSCMGGDLKDIVSWFTTGSAHVCLHSLCWAGVLFSFVS